MVEQDWNSGRIILQKREREKEPTKGKKKRRRMSMKSKGACVEVSGRNVLHRKWALLLCVASFCAGMFFTNRYLCFWVSIFQHQVWFYFIFSCFVWLWVMEFLGCKGGYALRKNLSLPVPSAMGHLIHTCINIFVQFPLWFLIGFIKCPKLIQTHFILFSHSLSFFPLCSAESKKGIGGYLYFIPPSLSLYM